MKLTNKQYIVAGLGLIALSATVAVVVVRHRKKNEIAEITKIISGGVNQFGDYNDIPTMNAFNPAFWRKKELEQGRTYDFNKAINIAKSLHGYIVTGEDELAYTILTGTVSQQQISEISEAYKTTYKGANLGLDLTEALSDTWLNKIYIFINTLPIKK